MKQSILILIALFNLNVLFAQDNPPLSKPQDRNLEQNQQKQMPTEKFIVPGSVNDQFSKDYPNINGQWEKYGTDYRAVYNESSSTLGRAAIYNSSGKVVGMEKELSTGEYPNSIDKHLSSTYPNEQHKVWTYVDASGSQSFFISRNNDRMWFDKSGAPFKVKSPVK